MIISTTDSADRKEVQEYTGIVAGEAVMELISSRIGKIDDGFYLLIKHWISRASDPLTNTQKRGGEV